MTTPAHLTPEEFLTHERASLELKHEYHRGKMIQMDDANRNHNLLAVSLSWHLADHLHESRRETYISRMRLKVDVTGLYTYPDLIVTCEEPCFEDEHVDTLLNPQVIFEILSESTETYDRGKKFEHYRGLDSLREYVLVAQDRPHIEVFTREGATWRLTEATGIDSQIAIGSIDLTLPLSEVYAKLNLGDEA